MTIDETWQCPCFADFPRSMARCTDPVVAWFMKPDATSRLEVLGYCEVHKSEHVESDAIQISRSEADVLDIMLG